MKGNEQSTTKVMQDAMEAAQKVLKRSTGKEMAIVMTVGSFDGPHIGNYISNVQREHGAEMLLTTAERIMNK